MAIEPVPEQVVELHERLSQLLDLARTYFKDPVRLMLIVRNNEHPDRHVVMTNEDDIELAFAAARYNVANEATGHVIPKGDDDDEL